MTKGADVVGLDGIAQDARFSTCTDRLTAIDQLEATLSAIRLIEPEVHAFVTMDPERALRQAALLDSKPHRVQGRLSLVGAPIGIKDLIDTQDLATGYGCPHYTGFIPAKDATIVTRIRATGVIIVGKTVTDELALEVFSPPTRNPWDTGRIPGGSSGGSAAAVAARECFGALGTDTGGSVRIPASCCGVVGLKPTHGVLPTTGVMPLSKTLDHVGILARTVSDVETIFRALTKTDISHAARPEPQSSRTDLSLMRFAVIDNWEPFAVDLSIRDGVQYVLSQLEGRGAEFIPFPGRFFREACEYGSIIEGAEAYRQHRSLLGLSGNGASPRAERILLEGKNISTDAYLSALEHGKRLARELAGFCRRNGVAAVLSPTLPATAAPVGCETISRPGGSPMNVNRCYETFCRLANLTGWPAISVPCGFDDAGLPIGLQVMGKPHADARILELAREVESAARQIVVNVLPPVLSGVGIDESTLAGQWSTG